MWLSVEGLTKVPDLFLDIDHMISQIRETIKARARFTKGINNLFKGFYSGLECLNPSFPSIDRGVTAPIEAVTDRFMRTFSVPRHASLLPEGLVAIRA